MLLLRGHKGPVRALAYSPDGGILATGGDDRTVRLWDLTDGEALTTFSGHTDTVRGLVFHPAGKAVHSGSWDGTIQGWFAELKRGAKLLTHLGPVWALAVSPDGHDLAFGAGNKVQVWRFAEDQPRFNLEGHTWPVTGVAFANGGKHVVTVGQDRTIHLWDAYWGKLLQTTPAHPDWLHGVAVAPDSRTMASAGGDGLIRLNAIPALTPTGTLCGHRGDVFAVAFLAGGRTLLSTGADGTVRLWDVIAGKELRALQLGMGRLFRVAIAPDGMTAAVASESNNVLLVDLDFADS